jgi:hypothetical protein
MIRALVLPLELLQKARGIPGFPDLQSIPFRKIEGDYSASRGVVQFQPFLLDSDAIGMTTTGSVDMGAKTANLKVASKLPIGPLDLTVTGSLASPTIRPVLSTKQKEQVTKFLQDQGQQLLKQLFHR